jgi:catechol 2,3-dioxygenase-like lactoylglutathione lyase family enzyme
VRIDITERFVDDQDKALRLYTEVLGFLVKTDAPYSDTARWLTVVSPEQPDGPELLLAPMTDAYGGADAVFEVGCGNLVNLHQPAE